MQQSIYKAGDNTGFNDVRGGEGLIGVGVKAGIFSITVTVVGEKKKWKTYTVASGITRDQICGRLESLTRDEVLAAIGG